MSSGEPDVGATGSRPAKGTVALFPGMAAAFPGMGRPLAGTSAGARVYAAFSQVSGVDVAALACEAERDELHRDRHWELAVVATEAAALEVWRSGGREPAASLGFSIGAYAALLAAEAVTVTQIVAMIDTVLEASLRLPGRFSMLSVAGAPVAEVRALCRPGEVELAAVIAPGLTLVGGTASAVADLAQAVASIALRIRQLPVRWPLHTSLMAPVAEALEHQRSRVGELRPLRHPVYSALGEGTLSSPEEGWRLLVDHICHPQRFDLAFEAVRGNGCVRCVELGPCGTLHHAVRLLGRGGVELECFPKDVAPARRGRVRRC